ncbi:MAG: hypothetical protein DI535_17885 [Citrobacter freundii]|nr:MAG: hypothetical protein DI535_17885 [Citrobacter freundii]
MSKAGTPRDLGQLVDNLRSLATGYITLQKRIAKLTFIQYLAKAGGALIDGVISFILICIVLVFGAITGALWISSRTGSYVSGFGWMTVIVAAIVFIIHLLRKPLFVDPIIHRLVRKMHTETEQINKENSERTDPY